MSAEAPEPEDLFLPENAIDFDMTLISAATVYETALDTVRKYERDNSQESKEGLGREIQDTEVGEKLTSIVGGLGDMKITAVPMGEGAVSKEDYELAQTQLTEIAIPKLFYLVRGYQVYLADKLRPVFDEGDELGVAEASWPVVWERLRDTLRASGGTALVEVLRLFDDLIKLEYGSFYSANERTRGPVVSRDPGNRIFYEVMENHLPTAIMKSGEDSWTGY